MRRNFRGLPPILWIGLFGIMPLVLATRSGHAVAPAQVTSEIYIVVTFEDGVNVRGGPNTAFYPIVGHLEPGQTAPALGRTPEGDWIQIAYADAPGGVGWVYAYYVELRGGVPPVVPTPLRPLPVATETVSADMLTALAPLPTPTRLPTFTPPPPLFVPTYPTPVPSVPGRTVLVPLIFTLALLGLIAGLVGRRAS